MKTLALVLLLAGCASVPVESPAPETPQVAAISAVFYEYCDKLQGAVVTFSDGDTRVVERSTILEDPEMMARLNALPHIWVHMSSPEICGCFT